MGAAGIEPTCLHLLRLYSITSLCVILIIGLNMFIQFSLCHRTCKLLCVNRIHWLNTDLAVALYKCSLFGYESVTFVVQESMHLFSTTTLYLLTSSMRSDFLLLVKFDILTTVLLCLAIPRTWHQTTKVGGCLCSIWHVPYPNKFLFYRYFRDFEKRTSHFPFVFHSVHATRETLMVHVLLRNYSLTHSLMQLGKQWYADHPQSPPSAISQSSFYSLSNNEYQPWSKAITKQ